MSSDQILGIVENGAFFRLGMPGLFRECRQTDCYSPQAAQAPESGQLDLRNYEGSAIMITGHDQGEWIYSAAIIDQAGSILTAVVKQMFGATTEAESNPN